MLHTQVFVKQLNPTYEDIIGRILRKKESKTRYSTEIEGPGGFQRVALRAANLKWSIAGGNRTLIPRRVTRERDSAPLIGFFGIFLAEGERYPPEAPEVTTC